MHSFHCEDRIIPVIICMTINHGIVSKQDIFDILQMVIFVKLSYLKYCSDICKKTSHFQTDSQVRIDQLIFK